MRFFSFLLIGALFTCFITGWETDFEKAKQRATYGTPAYIAEFFRLGLVRPLYKPSSRDIRKCPFKEFADNSLVLLNADFPRLKKNQLTKDQQKKNDLLADKYNGQGHFPYTVLLNAGGKVISSWDGLPKETPEEFIAQLKALINANN